jgi:hypothetical protein
MPLKKQRMRSKSLHIISVLSLCWLLASCTSSKIFSTDYYNKHEKTLTEIEQSYKKLYEQNRFSVGFTDRSFNDISLEIYTDSIKYIYEFSINEPRFLDTLKKFDLPAQGIVDLINKMKSIQCIWVNNLDYYILTFYSQPQYFDEQGRLLSTRRQRKLRKINDDIFHRINDKVCYAVSERFR